MLAVSIILPIFIVAATHIGICYFRHQRKSVKLGVQQATRMEENEVGERKVMVTTISMLVIAFFVLWTPGIIYAALEASHQQLPLWYAHLVFLLRFCRGILNPIIYIQRHRQFKEELKRCWFRFIRKERICKCASVELSDMPQL